MNIVASSEVDGVTMTIYENGNVVIAQDDDLIEMTIDTMDKVNKACYAKLEAYAIENNIEAR